MNTAKNNTQYLPPLFTDSRHDFGSEADGKIRIFFADSQNLFRSILALFLSDKLGGAEVIQSNSLEGLVASLEAHDAHINPGASLIIADLSMPGMVLPKSICDLTKRFGDIPLIALPGMFNSDEVYTLMEVGAKAVIPMTSDPKLLVHVVALVMDGHTYFPSLWMAGDPGNDNTSPSARQLACLTDRELEVTRWVANGLANKKVARTLGIAEGTVKVMVRSIFKKLQINNRTLLAKLYLDSMGRDNTNTQGTGSMPH